MSKDTGDEQVLAASEDRRPASREVLPLHECIMRFDTIARQQEENHEALLNEIRAIKLVVCGNGKPEASLALRTVLLETQMEHLVKKADRQRAFLIGVLVIVTASLFLRGWDLVAGLAGHVGGAR